MCTALRYVYDYKVKLLGGLFPLIIPSELVSLDREMPFMRYLHWQYCIDKKTVYISLRVMFNNRRPSGSSSTYNG